jgi:hypothetical protein
VRQREKVHRNVQILKHRTERVTEWKKREDPEQARDKRAEQEKQRGRDKGEIVEKTQKDSDRESEGTTQSGEDICKEERN